MIPHQTSPEQVLNVARYGLAMEAAGLPKEFVAGVMRLAQEDQGVFELMELWHEAGENVAERDPIIADLQEVLDEAEELPQAPLVKPRIDYRNLETVASTVMIHKRKLRDLIDRHGGVTAVARRMEIPQSSLSRMLNSASMPRRTTLYRLARALEVEEAEVVGEWVR